MSFSIRWLGVAGFHIRTTNHSILIDPYFSRLPLRKMWFGKVQPDLSVIQSQHFPADAILVSHAHIDHLLDVPVIAREQNIPVFGSSNTCHILNTMRLPSQQIHHIQAGDTFQLGDIYITVLTASHIRMPGFQPGALPENLHPPLRARQYKMDDDYCFLIKIDGLTLITDPGHPFEPPLKVDILTLFPFHSRELLKEILSSTHPARVIPSHWDDFWQPISKPLRPMFQPPQRDWPPIQRANLQKFTRHVQEISPGTEVIQLDLFQEIIIG